MLKIISCDTVSIPAGSEKIKLYSRYPTVLLILEGSAFINKERTEMGEGCFASELTNVHIKSDGHIPCLVARFELDGRDTESILETQGLTENSPVIRFNTNGSACTDFARLVCNGTELLGNTAFCEAAAKLLLSLAEVQTEDENATVYGNAHVDRAVRFIDGNLSSDLRVERIAERLGIDRMYLRNLFAEHVGMSTMEYIMNTRMERAKTLLSNERLTVSEVANAVGYKDVLAFSKAFKKHVGSSPTDFRKGTKKDTYVSRAKQNDVPIFIL